jgi:transcriptional regulator with XRE-family HTH domain
VVVSPLQVLAEKLRKARERCEMTAGQVAEDLNIEGVSGGTILAYEEGRMFDTLVLLAIMACVGLSPNEAIAGVLWVDAAA